MTAEDILMTFYDKMTFKRDKFGWSSNLDLSFYKGKVINSNILDANSGKVLIQQGTKVNQRILDEIIKKKIKMKIFDF